MFLIRSLELGGAERQLVELAGGLHRRGRRVSVATFYGHGELAAELRAGGTPLISLEKQGRWDLIGPLSRLRRLVRNRRPQVLHCYLPTSNSVGAVLRLFAPAYRLACGIRAVDMSLAQYGILARVSYALERLTNRFADLIIVNSHAGAERYLTEEGSRGRVHVVPNGIDTARFWPDESGREQLRREWRVSSTDLLIGYVGRLDPIKDHETFLRAAALLSSDIPRARFVCVGGGSPDYAASLRRRAGELGLGERVLFAGVRHDMAAVYSALDVATSASSAESFPNAVAEAMACGVPCAVTNVGDSARIVGEVGVVVPRQDPSALAAAWRVLMGDRRPPAAAVRARIVREFSVDRMLDATEQLLWLA